MAHSLSAKKRIRQSKTRQMRNQSRTSSLKTQTRKFLDAVNAKDLSSAEKQFRVLVKKLDQIADVGTIHKNNAARQKSRMQVRLNTLKKSTAAK